MLGGSRPDRAYNNGQQVRFAEKSAGIECVQKRGIITIITMGCARPSDQGFIGLRQQPRLASPCTAYRSEHHQGETWWYENEARKKGVVRWPHDLTLPDSRRQPRTMAAAAAASSSSSSKTCWAWAPILMVVHDCSRTRLRIMLCVYRLTPLWLPLKITLTLRFPHACHRQSTTINLPERKDCQTLLH